MNLVFLGPPGAGKGTQAERVCARFGLAHISTGDMLRQQMREGTPLGLEAKSLIERGELVPDDVIIGMVAERVKAPDCQNGFLLDGFPRTIAQADALASIAPVSAAINLAVPDEVLVGRISGRRMCSGCGAAYHVSAYAEDTCAKCGAPLYIRDDDKPETVQSRIAVYNEKTLPLILYYEDKGLLRNVNGDRAPDEVLSDVAAIVERLG